MKLSEYIKKLQVLQATNGDLEVMRETGGPASFWLATAPAPKMVKDRDIKVVEI